MAAHQEGFASLDRKISSVSADTRATRQATQDVKAEVSRFRSDRRHFQFMLG